MGIVILDPLLGLTHMGSVVIMSLESKINKLIDKHQSLADNYHRNAETFWNRGHYEKSIKADKLAHPHEQIASELRLVLMNV